MTKLKEFIESSPIISTHEHHERDSFQQKLDLDLLFAKSYVSWCSLPGNESHEERAGWLEKIRHNSYFVWLEKALVAIYNVDRITAGNWDLLSDKIRHAHAEPAYHMAILRDKALYARFLQDSYWDPGSDAGHPELAVPIYRTDMWLTGFHPMSSNHDQMNPHLHLGMVFRSLDEYEEALRAEITRRRSQIVALKCASAYERGLDFAQVSKGEAAAVFGRTPAEISPAERKAFSDYIFGVTMDIVAELGLPYQIHTGLGQLRGTNPMSLEPTIAAHPEVRFILLHGGFPWIHEATGLLHNYRNVVIDLCWLPLISTTAAIAALHEYIEVAPSADMLTWGGDCWTSEESLGAAMAIRFVLAKVLSERVEQGYCDPKDAKSMAERIMSRNAKSVYHI